MDASSAYGYLAEQDPELHALVLEEEHRQFTGIELIASENFTSLAVRDCLGSILTNKYSEGQPGCRFYGGNEVIDKIEILCKERALKAFNLNELDWHVNVQAYSGSPANFAVYSAFLAPHDRLMGLALPAGGHLTHGFYTNTKKVSASSIYFESFPYGVDKTGRVDFEELRKNALIYLPKLLICGASAYARTIEFEEFRKVADEVGCLLMADISHISGLVAGGVHPSPFAYCDIVTTTTHKTLRGPRSAIVFVNKKRMGANAADKLNQAVFPGLQGGPHNHQIAAVACQLLEVASPRWRVYAQQIVANSKAIAASLLGRGYELVTGGTDNHLVLWNLRPLGISGAKLEKVAEAVGISLNKNSVPGDSGVSTNGVRIGTPAMTSRGCTEEDMKEIAECLHECVIMTQKIQGEVGKALHTFVLAIAGREDIALLAERVKKFSVRFTRPSSLNGFK